MLAQQTDNMRQTPVALFTYSRPQHTELALDALSHCTRLDACCIYIYCDGPKTPEQATVVAESRRVVHRWASSLKATVVEREHNLGLARSIVTGVTDLCQQYGRVIVLEDDLVVSPDFLEYMLQALDLYKDATNVYQISGYMFPVKHPDKPDAFFLPLTTTWGWATWDRAWKIFDWEPQNALRLLENEQMRKKFDLDGSYPYTEMLKQRLAGENSSWGILWWWAVFNAQGLVLHPRRSLVWVGGFDSSGTHCGSESDFRQLPVETFICGQLSNPIVYPTTVLTDRKAFHRIKTILRTQPGAPSPFFWTRLAKCARRVYNRILKSL